MLYTTIIRVHPTNIFTTRFIDVLVCIPFLPVDIPSLDITDVRRAFKVGEIRDYLEIIHVIGGVSTPFFSTKTKLIILLCKLAKI